MHLTFHRAFDDTFEFDRSIDTLIESGVNRVLSSGLASNVDQGIATLCSMKEYAAGRIEIMPGGGVNASNIRRIIDEVQPDGIHFSGTQKFILDEDSRFSESILRVNREKVRRLLEGARIQPGV